MQTHRGTRRPNSLANTHPLGLAPRMGTLVLFVVLGFACASHAPKSNARPKSILVVAHRGAHTEAPENSLAAISRAIDLGCDYVEVDVRQTRDGALVLMHDSSVDRTTDGTGKVADLTLSKVSTLHLKPRGLDSPAARRVPTFDEALRLCRGRIRVLVDNKAGPPSKVIAALEAHGMLEDVVVYDSVERLRELKRLSPTLSIQPPHPGSIEEITRLVENLAPQTLDGNAVEWNREQVDAAHQAGARVWVDNLGERDNEAGVYTAVGLNVDAIQTDLPEMTLRLLEKLGYQSAEKNPAPWHGG